MSDKKPAQDTKDLVVVGSSAGGVGALSVLVSTLKEDFPAPIVLAQHLDPQRPSNLSTILERHSQVPIVVVTEGAPTHLEQGTVYVVPANRHVAIQEGHVHLEEDHEGRPRPSIDRLLSSAADSYGEHLIAVILTGAGSDGAAGAVEVKNAGGVVIIQNPETAQYPSMPRSLPPTVVDHVVEMERIGPVLYNLLSGVKYMPPDKDNEPLRELLAQVTRYSNIDFSHYKPTTILRRISRRMAVTHHVTIEDYRHYLEAHPEEVSELIKTFLIKVTGFFRDPAAYEYLGSTVLPELIERGREQGRVLRFWSAGCATGEEPYSLALLLADLLGPELGEWSIKIFATDLDEHAINFARHGFYPGNVLNNLPEGYRKRYFETVDQGYRITKTLRSLVIFGQQDLSRGVPFPRIDLVVCRNLLIYLKLELQQAVLDLFAFSLQHTHGYLFLGKAETARPTKATFELVNKKWKVYRCTSGPLTLRLPQQRLAGLHTGLLYNEQHNLGRHFPQADRQPPSPEANATEVEVAQFRRFNELMLRYLPTGVVIIDRAYRIVMTNSSARRLLGIREMANEQDFLHTVHGLPYAAVRNAIDAVFREHSTVTLPELELDQRAGGDGRYVCMTVTLMQLEPGLSDMAVISVSDATEQVQTRRRLEAVQAEQTQLVNELSTTNKRLSDVNKELQDANEELQAANEELMLTQEELQATNEEFEATNEELQATNEELETNNEELQATNEELQTTNDELTARTNELQELAKTLANECVRLSEMVEHSPLYILLVKGPGLLIEAYNPRYQPLLEGREVIGHPFEEFFRGPKISEFVSLVREAYQQDRIITTLRMATFLLNEKEEPLEGHFVHTLVPAHDSAGKVHGVVIYSENLVESERGGRNKDDEKN
jgi:two-component system CheB/CheR fusion protein